MGKDKSGNAGGDKSGGKGGNQPEKGNKIGANDTTHRHDGGKGGNKKQ